MTATHRIAPFIKSTTIVLRDSSKREPLEFFQEVLRHDLPVTAFLDSDFRVVDERLAKHYGSRGGGRGLPARGRARRRSLRRHPRYGGDSHLSR